VKRARLLLVVFVGAVAGCGGGEGGSGGDEITFMVFGDPEEVQAYREVIAAYEKKQPGVNVKLIVTSDRDDLIARLSTSFAGGTPPDLFLLNYRFYGKFAARGVLEPIESRVDASGVFQQEDFYEVALDAFRFGGTLTCLPQNISSLDVYYNKDLFREAGLPEPRSGWRWTDMVSAAKQLTKDEDGDGMAEVYGLGVEASLIRIAPFVWSNGGELVDDEDSPTHFTLDSPEAEVVLNEFFRLRLVHKAVPSDEEVEAEDDETRFQNGRLAMVLSSRRSTPTFRTITEFDWDVAPLPQFKEQAGILHSDAYCLTKASENKDAAWDFIEYALGPEGAPVVARSGRTVPSLKEVAESQAFLDPTAKPANSQVFLDTIPVIRRVPSISTWPEIEDAAASILEEALYEGESAEDVARRLREATDPIFARGEG
jgi:multiple sugar transport system substrate-binding protein